MIKVKKERRLLPVLIGVMAAAMIVPGCRGAGAPEPRLLQTLETPAAKGTPGMTLEGYGWNIGDDGRATETDEPVKTISEVRVGRAGKTVQVIRDSAWIETYDGKMCHGIELRDVDFDGRPDLLFHAGCGAQNHCYHIWRFRPERNIFVYDPVFSEAIAGSIIDCDPSTKTIRCRWHVGGESEDQFLETGKKPSEPTVFRVRDGQLTDRNGNVLPDHGIGRGKQE